MPPGVLGRAVTMEDSEFVGDGAPPTSEDLARVVLARATARLAVSHAFAAHEAALWKLFRREIGSVVRRVSPVLVAILERETMPLDEVVWSIGPGRGWPLRPMNGMRAASTGRRTIGGAEAAALRTRLFGSGLVLGLRDGSRIRVEVLDGGIEMVGRCGVVRVATRGDVARLTVPGAVPTVVARAAIGRPAAALVDLDVLRGRDWTVTAVETRRPAGGSTFVVDTGCRPYVLPWARAP